MEKSGDIMDSADRVDLGFEGADTLFVDVGGVHAAGPEVADLLRHAAGFGGVIVSGLFADIAKALINIFLNEVADAPAALGRGDGGRFDPATVCIIKEVGTGADAGIDVCSEEVGGGLFLFIVTSGQGKRDYGYYDAVGFHDVCD